MNWRKCKVFVHPTLTCGGILFPGISAPTIEFPTDTARTIASLALTGTMARYRDITFLFSHGGGTLPAIAQRFAGPLRQMSVAERARKLPNGLEHELKRQYYDLASVGASPAGMAAVLKLWPISQLTYGSDAPFGSSTGIADGILALGLSEVDLAAIWRDNALRLFPHYA
ncbi:MAG: amidohydrolase family protein [Stellaceae bacterium]